MDYQQKVNEFFNRDWSQSNNKNKAAILLDCLMSSESEDDFNIRMQRVLERFPGYKNESHWLEIKYNECFNIIDKYDSFDFLNARAPHSYMSSFFLKKLFEKNKEDNLSSFIRIYFVELKDIAFLLEKKAFSNALIIRNMFNERTTDRRYDSYYHINNKFKTDYFKELLEDYGYKMFIHLNNEEKKEIFTFLKKNKYTAKLPILNHLFKDLEIDEDYIKKYIFALFNEEAPKKYTASRFEVYFNNINNDTLINVLKEKDFDEINYFIMPYLFERNILKSFNKQDVEDQVCELSSAEKISVWKNADREKRDEWMSYIFNERYNSGLDYANFYKVNSGLFDNQYFLKYGLKEFKRYFEDNFYKILISNKVDLKEEKNTSKIKVFNTFFEKMKELGLYEEDKIIMEAFKNFERRYSTQLSSKDAKNLIEDKYHLFKVSMIDFFDISEEKLRINGNLNPKYYNQRFNADFKAFVERNILQESLLDNIPGYKDVKRRRI